MSFKINGLELRIRETKFTCSKIMIEKKTNKGRWASDLHDHVNTMELKIIPGGSVTNFDLTIAKKTGGIVKRLVTV